MGRWKLLLPFRGRTVIEWSVENALSACGRVILVGGFRAEEMAELFRGRPEVRFVLNDEYPKGMFSSIRRGAEAALAEKSADEGAFLALGDMPAVDPAVYLHLDRCRREAPPPSGALRPVFGEKNGHPVLMGRGLLVLITGFPPEATMRDVFAVSGLPGVVPVRDPGVLRDLDTPEDYASFTGVP